MQHSDEFIASICPSFDLKLDSVSHSLLWLIPVINVMWADGRIQREEAEVLLGAADRFVRLHSADAPELTHARVGEFLAPFLDSELGSDPWKRAELTRLADFIVNEMVAPDHRDKRDHLFDICVEVAAAARATEEDREGRRISSGEEVLLKELLGALRLGV
jgi:hypothetical protein